MSLLTDEWKLEEAVEVAVEERMEKAAKYLLTKGMSVEEVVEATGLTVDDILRL